MLELLVLRRAVIDLEELEHRGIVVALGEVGLRLGQQLRADLRLLTEDALHARLLRHVLTRGRTLRRAGNDERRTRLVDQDAVHLVHDGEGMAALHHLRGVGRHAVVAQIVEAELTVRAVGDVAGILLTALGRTHGVLYASHRQPQVLEEVAHELRVAPRQVIVHRHQVRRTARERVQIEREGRHQRLAFARLHLGDLTLVQDDAADDLHVKGNHVPGDLVAADLHGRPHQAAARVLHRGIRLRQQVIERLALRQTVTELLRLGLQLLLTQRLILLLNRVHLVDNRQQLLDVALVLRAENQFQKVHGKSLSNVIPSISKLLAVRFQASLLVHPRKAKRTRERGDYSGGHASSSAEENTEAPWAEAPK